MENIIIRGPYSQSGFGKATIGLIQTAKAAGYDVKFIPVNSNPQQDGIGFSKETAGFITSIKISDTDACIKNSIVIDVGSLIYALSITKLDCKKSIIYTTTETIDIHEHYVYTLNQKFDEVWTASNFNKIGFMNSKVENTINVLPHYIDINDFTPDKKPFNIKNKKGYNFLYNIDFSFRKGLHLLLPAFCKTFKKDDDVSLILKVTNSIFGDQGIEHSINSMNELCFNLNLDTQYPDHAPIQFIFGSIEDKFMPSLYNSVDCYVSSALAEGFGIPIVEAMACELPVIISRCSAPLDYVNRKCGLFTNLDEENPTQPITDRSLLQRDPRYQGRKIYNINQDSLEENLRYAYMNIDEMKEKGKFARERILKRLSLETLADKFKSFIDVKEEKIEL